MALFGGASFRPSSWTFTRSLRFRLTLSYVVFFAILLSSLGILFRQALVTLLDRQTRALLEEEELDDQQIAALIGPSVHGAAVTLVSKGEAQPAAKG